MIWVIGDIHGMFDPLKRIFITIRKIRSYSNEPVEKIIFLGDYIDYGPSSKEVIDYILDLNYDKVCLTGDHEDAVLSYICGDEDYKNTPKSEMPWLNEDISSKNGKLLLKYENFLKGLKYFHQETLNFAGQDRDFLFSHSMPDSAYPIAKQKFTSHDDFTQFLKSESVLKAEMSPDFADDKLYYDLIYHRNKSNSIIYNDKYQKNINIENEIVIHGHIRTYMCDHPSVANFTEEKIYDNQFMEYDYKLFLPFILSKYSKAEFQLLDTFYGHRVENYLYVNKDIRKILAINIDTGAVYGGALTALGLSSDLLAKGIMPLITIPMEGGQRQPENKLMFRIISFKPDEGFSPYSKRKNKKYEWWMYGP
jgi:serine/threonine protein phosphatase 1